MSNKYFVVLVPVLLLTYGCAWLAEDKPGNTFVVTSGGAYLEEIFFVMGTSGPDTLLYAKSSIEGDNDTIIEKAGLNIGTDLIKERDKLSAHCQLEYVKTPGGSVRKIIYADSSDTRVHLRNYRISTTLGGKSSAGIQFVKNHNKYEVIADDLTIYTRVKNITSYFSSEFKAVMKGKSCINCRIVVFDGVNAKVNEYEYCL